KMRPGDPWTGLIDPKIEPAISEQKRIAAGYYDPIPVQYFRWGGNLLQGDFGQSVIFKQPVVDVIMQRVNNTIGLSLLTMVLT
ncbi:ABC transporter permease, partial [Streptococcus suis]